MKPEFYIFIDERHEPPHHPTRIIVSAIITEQNSWRNNFGEAAQVGRIHDIERLGLINQLLFQAKGFGVVMYADTKGYGGVTHYTDDISQMAANDNIWSQMVVFVISRALRCLGDSISESALIEIYHDQESLRSEHNTAFRKGIQLAFKKSKAIRGCDFSIGQIDQITRKGRESPNIFQQGVMIADHLCGNAPRLIAGENMPLILCEKVNIEEDTLHLFGERP